jgi:hypothetical protein
MSAAQPTLDVAGEPPRFLAWAPRARWGLAIGAVAALGLLSVSRGSAFLYWQF